MAFAVFFRVLFNATFAGRIQRLAAATGDRTHPPVDQGANGVGAEADLAPTAPASAGSLDTAPESPAPRPPGGSAPLTAHEPTAALQLLTLLQREGRLLDFLHEDISGFADADVGAAARVVHGGCRKVLDEHLDLRPVRDEAEGAAVTLPDGFASAEVRLTGNVTGSAPFRGTLNHRGWRAAKITLPQLSQGHDPQILAPAEVEL